MHHAVIITKNGSVVLPEPASHADLTSGLDLGDTVSFSSKDGKIRIQIVDVATQLLSTPFKEPNSSLIESEAIFTVSKPGLYCFRCAVKGPKDADFVGWSDTAAGHSSGVEVPVPPHR